MRIAVGTENGVIVLKPGKSEIDTWSLLSHTQQGRSVQALLSDQHGAIIAATAQGSIHKTKDGENWMTTIEGLEGLNIKSLSFHPDDPLIMFCGTQPPAIYRSTTGGLRWQKVPSFNALPGAASWSYPVPPYRARVTRIIQHPLHANVVMAAVAQGGFLGSLDSGLTWMERPVSTGREVNDIILHHGAPTRIIAATSTGLFRSLDLGSTWQQVQHGAPYMFAWCLAVSPENPNFIMASLSQQCEESGPQMIVCTENGGDTWSVRNTGLPSLNGQRITSISASGSQTFAFSTRTGNIYMTTNGGELWRCIYLSSNSINAIRIVD